MAGVVSVAGVGTLREVAGSQSTIAALRVASSGVVTVHIARIVTVGNIAGVVSFVARVGHSRVVREVAWSQGAIAALRVADSIRKVAGSQSTVAALMVASSVEGVSGRPRDVAGGQGTVATLRVGSPAVREIAGS